jgi:diguanylate cyclase (GGDEF)-like protein
LSRLSIRTRLLSVLVVLVGFGMAAQAYGFVSNTRDIAALRDRSAALLALQQVGHEIEAQVFAQHDAIEAYILTADESLLTQYHDAQVREAEVAAGSGDILGAFPQANQDMAALRGAVEAWRVDFADKAVGLATSGASIQSFAPALEDTGVKRFNGVTAMQAAYDKHLVALYQETVQTLSQTVATQTQVFILSIIGVTIGMIVAIWLVTHWMINPLGELLRTAKQIRDGDDDVKFRAHGNDEIGRLGGELEQMRTSLSDQTAEAGVINRFTELTSFVESDGDVARATLDALGELTRPTDGMIHISNRSRDRAAPESSIGQVQTAVIPLGQLAQCPGVKRSSRYVTSDLAAHLAVRCPLYPATTGTLACIPLIALGDVIGAVHLHWDQVDGMPLEIRAAVSRVTDHASLAIANRRLVVALQGQASTDGRTGLPNSRTFDETLERSLSARSSYDPMAVLMLDVDHFKSFNDRNGHPAGDQALRTFAGILATSIRDGDLAARYGGEEFSVLLPGASSKDAHVVAERIRARTEAAVIELSPGHRDQITVSIGIAIWPDDAASRVDLLEAADAALYRAKRGGRNQIVIAGEVLSPREGELANAEAEIAAAIAAMEADAAAPAQAESDVDAAAWASPEGLAPEPFRLPRAG